MRNSKLIKLICLVLCLFMAVSLLGACSDKEGASSSEPSVSSEDSLSTDEFDDGEDVDEDQDEGEDDYYDEPYEEGTTDEWGDFGEEDEWGYSDDQNNEEALYVYNNEAPINTKYRGMSSTVYHAYGHMLNDVTGRAYTDEMLNLELSRLQDAGVHYTRTRYTTEWAWDAKVDGWNWDSQRMQYYWQYCRNLQERDIEVLQQVGWHLACITDRLDQNNATIKEHVYVMRGENYDDKYGESNGYDFSKCPDDDYKRYAVKALRLAEAHAQLLLEAKKRGINNITHLMYFTEPSPNYRDAVTGEMIYIGSKADEYVFIVQTIQQKLKDRGVYNMVRHVGPNQGSITTGDGLLRYMLEKDLVDMFDVWTAHFYPKAGDAARNVYFDIIDPVVESYLQPLKDVGVYQKIEFWIDEFYTCSEAQDLGVDSPWAGLQMAVGGIIAQQRGVNNISIWQIFDQLWTDQNNTGGEFVDGIHVCGSVPSLFISSIPRSQYYSTSLFAKYHGYQNGKVYRTNNSDLQLATSDIHVGAVQLEDGSWTITVVNASVESYTFTLEFEKAIYQTLYRHLNNVTTTMPTTAAHLADADKTFANVKDKFTDTLEGGSVAIYTGVKG